MLFVIKLGVIKHLQKVTNATDREEADHYHQQGLCTGYQQTTASVIGKLLVVRNDIGEDGGEGKYNKRATS